MLAALNPLGRKPAQVSLVYLTIVRLPVMHPA